ncbi:hypothetical protein [Bosea sp. (in: a-proteobacteria)]|jgi:hypothetical protein|uniref:hypothetical protein n=1 Tax=Bosea sp. (in: a-proteobacteria) TaxID=1871050 RepID=UPI002DDD452E|nr:hypothetical protein [Bosea sp. (in: a-proteobacteria)]HEV2509800.1 hypothetical protein [Bosea sp. (in: a-proteobacteria)]
MPASPTTTHPRNALLSSHGLYHHGEPEALALQLLVEKRARQRNLQRDVAVKAANMLAELGNQARAADLDLLVTFLELAAAEAERERSRWGDAAG